MSSAYFLNSKVIYTYTLLIKGLCGVDEKVVCFDSLRRHFEDIKNYLTQLEEKGWVFSGTEENNFDWLIFSTTDRQLALEELGEEETKEQEVGYDDNELDAENALN